MKKENKPKVGILTTFYNFNPEYSLCTVVSQQLEMLIKYGYTPVLFTLPSFNDDKMVPQGTEIRKVVPQLILEPYGEDNFDNLEEDSLEAQEAFEDNMEDMDVILTHDIIFINSFLPYNKAIRDASETKLSHVKWLHWMHSGPSARKMDGTVRELRYTLPKNSRLVYMNHTDSIRAAEMYGIWNKDVRVISNPMDIRSLHNFHEITNSLIDKYDLMSADIIDVYPLSTTRMDKGGKQLSHVIRVMAELKKRGKSIRLVVCNAHANGEREKLAIQEMYGLALSLGMERRELIFTSLHDIPNNEGGVPHEVVRDLFILSNLFIFPSVSENCPLVLLEAMASKNLLVLNKNFPALKDFGGPRSLYFNFGSLLETPHYPSGINEYLSDVAKIIISELNNEKVLYAQDIVRKRFNLDYIFNQQLGPSIMEIYRGY